MNKFLLVLWPILFTANFAAAAPKTISPSTNSMDFGVIAGSFAKPAKSVTAGGYTYSVIAPYLFEPACNPTQLVVWVDDDRLAEGVTGAAYNLGVQISKLVSVTAVGDEVKIVYRRNDTTDCSTSNEVTVYLKYPGEAKPLEIR